MLKEKFKVFLIIFFIWGVSLSFLSNKSFVILLDLYDNNQCLGYFESL